MLPPFLNPRKQAGLIISKRKADGGLAEEHEASETNEGLLVACEELIRAIHSKDAHGVMEALQSAFEIMDEAPHEEGEHIGEGEEA